MGLIRVLDHVAQCYNSADGQIIRNVIDHQLKLNEQVTISFAGVTSVPSSFVNAALISLLDVYDFETIKLLIRFSETNSEINDMIRSRFNFEANRRAFGPPNAH